jgi:hypothetical protein
MKLDDIKPIIKFIKPNLDFEWDEIDGDDELHNYYKTIFPNKEVWLKLASMGKETVLSNTVSLDNSTLDDVENDYDQLEPEKIARVNSAIENKTIELPIVLNDSGHLTLIAGNTRLTALKLKKLPLKVWMITV